MWRDVLADAVRNVRLHWLRVLLTGSGIAWGIALFVVLTALGSAVQGFYREKMESIGRKAVFVFPASVAKQGTGAATGRMVTFDRDDPPRLERTLLVEHVAPEVRLGARAVQGGGHTKVAWAYGVGPHTGRIRNVEVGGREEPTLCHLDGHPFREIGVA